MIEEIDPQVQEPQDASPSLASRMARRQEELQRQHTQRFPIPGWEDLLEVELRPIGVRPSARIVKRNERQRDDGTRQLYVMLDLLIQGTVGFWEVNANGGRPTPIQETWVTLAQRLPDCPDGPTERQALLFLVPEERLMFLYSPWEKWMAEASHEVDEVTMRDFNRTE